MRRGIHFLVAIAALSLAAAPAAAQSIATPIAVEASNVAAVHASSFGAYLHLQGTATPGDAGQGYFAYVGKVCSDDGGVTTLKDGGGNCFLRQPKSGISTITLEQFYQASDGTLWDNALTRAWAYQATQKACIILQGADYKFSNFTVPAFGCIIGQGTQNTRIVPTVANQTVVQLQGGSAVIENIGITDLLGVGGITCLNIGTVNLASHTATAISYSFVQNLACDQATVGVNWQPGGIGSSLYFNTINGFFCHSCNSSMMFRSGIDGDTANGNTIFNLHNVNVGGTPLNSWVNLSGGGDGNSFYGGSGNSVTGAGPLATPSMIYTGAGAVNNHFSGQRFEVATRNLDNHGPGNTFTGSGWTTGDWNLAVLPTNFDCAAGGVSCFEIHLGYQYETSSQVAGMPCNLCMYVPGTNGLNVVNSATVGKSLIDNADPTAFWAFDVTGQSLLSVANGACSAALPAGDGLITITDQVNGGDGITNLTGGGNVTILGRTGTHWAATPSASPSAGSESYAFSGGYKVCNNTGATATYIVGGTRTRSSN